jgi:hypothetical protein
MLWKHKSRLERAFSLACWVGSYKTARGFPWLLQHLMNARATKSLRVKKARVDCAELRRDEQEKIN